MEAKVTREFRGVEDGHIYPRLFKVGEVITGELAKAEIESGRAVDVKKKNQPENKAILEAPRNKHSSASPQAPASPKKTARRSKAKAKQSQSITPTK